MPVKKKAERPIFNPIQEIAALRKSLRWAMRIIPREDSMFCIHCYRRGLAAAKVIHKPKCPYAVACKLAGLRVKVKDS